MDVTTPAVLCRNPPEQELDAPLSTTAEPPAISPVVESARKSGLFANVMLLAVLFATPALMCVRGANVGDPDIWWHMQTGQWILLHHAVPHVDPFSGPLAGTPWLAYSWLFELIAVKLFQHLGLVGIVAYSAAMILAITVALCHLVRRLQGDLTLGVLLTFVAMYGMGHLQSPRPWMFTILFFILELDILMQARRTGRVRELAWLPVIFALWANTHIQFVDGLFVLGLALAEAVLVRWMPSQRTRIRPAWIGGALLASLLATLLNPYGWHIYGTAYDLATQGGALNKVGELQSIPFRDSGDYAILLLALGSAAALAWQRRFPLFESVLLVFAAVLSFRSQRDVWLIATVGTAILASSIAGPRVTPIRLPRLCTALAVIAAALAVWAGFPLLHVNNGTLQVDAAETLPIHAVEAIKANAYAGPIYNDFNWGGYLIWSLHRPVEIDGRQNLYGDQRIDRSVETWTGQPGWASDPALTSAGLVIGPVTSPLTQLLRSDPRFSLAFEDKLAAVFVPRK